MHKISGKTEKGAFRVSWKKESSKFLKETDLRGYTTANFRWTIQFAQIL